LDHNNPGDIWYRMPAVRVVQAVVYGERAYGESALPAQEDEGTFYVREGGLDDFAGVILLVSLYRLSHIAVRDRLQIRPTSELLLSLPDTRDFHLEPPLGTQAYFSITR
jgi:hypothetical protein